jgi:hypothetical protein
MQAYVRQSCPKCHAMMNAELRRSDQKLPARFAAGAREYSGGFTTIIEYSVVAVGFFLRIQSIRDESGT